jgi:rare lipoprotein A (peptidoglycan hydrolase)
MISAILLSVALAFHTSGVQVGQATWYGYTGNKATHCYGGYRNTCSPYLSKEDGGRGGELVMYAAVHGFKYRDKPYKVRVCLHSKPSKCVVVVVRDAIGGHSKTLIDLSPAAFIQLAPLSRGVLKVKVEGYDDYLERTTNRYGGR